ncbi:hypothetical protein ACM66B_000713 [Microbotryomycetes sp. NB124-2]
MPKVKADEPLSRQNLAAAVWYTVAKIAEEEEQNMNVTVSEHFVATLTELVFQQALSLGKDLERYAFHAGRDTVGVEDVKLACGRNEALYEHITTAAIKQGLSLSAVATKTTAPKPRARPRVSEGALKVSAAKKATAAAAPRKKPAAPKKETTASKPSKKKDVKGKGKAKLDSSSGGDTDGDDNDKVIDFAIMSQDEIDDASSNEDDKDGSDSSMDDDDDDDEEDMPKRKKGKLRRGAKKG